MIVVTRRGVSEPLEHDAITFTETRILTPSLTISKRLSAFTGALRH